MMAERAMQKINTIVVGNISIDFCSTNRIKAKVEIFVYVNDAIY